MVLDAAYDRRSWHGPNLRGSIRGVSLDAASWRPGRGRHNIWELVVHAAYWKYAGLRRLTGATRASFALTGSNWFERPIEKTAAAWRADLKLLEDAHRALRHAVAASSPRMLARKKKGSPFTHREIITGLAAHDLYHAGQIQMLKRLWRDRETHGAQSVEAGGHTRRERSSVASRSSRRR
jgi:uncharacterized damage-inducible protein DinB